ncbi:MAG: hypothetical protein AB7G36_18725 [Candidatus Nanopelagicales bacterium]
MIPTIDTTPYRAALSTFWADLGDACAFSAPELVPEAQTRERGRRIAKARADLAAATPPMPPSTDERRGVLLTSRRASGDTVSVIRHEREHVERMLAAGHGIEPILGEAATVGRIDAILDLYADQDTDEARAVRHAAVARLADLGVPEAVAIVRDEAAAAPVAAWFAVMTSAAENYGEPSMAAMTALHAADRDGYRAAFADPLEPGLSDRARHITEAADRLPDAA